MPPQHQGEPDQQAPQYQWQPALGGKGNLLLPRARASEKPDTNQTNLNRKDHTSYKPDQCKDPRPGGGPPPAQAHHYQPPQLKPGPQPQAPPQHQGEPDQQAPQYQWQTPHLNPRTTEGGQEHRERCSPQKSAEAVDPSESPCTYQALDQPQPPEPPPG